MTGFVTDNPAQRIAAMESAKKFEREQIQKAKAKSAEQAVFFGLSVRARLLSTTALHWVA
jgi:hypothetical protein